MEDRKDLLVKAGAVFGAVAVAGAGAVGLQMLDDHDTPTAELQMDDGADANSDTDVRIGGTSPEKKESKDPVSVQADRNERMLEQMSDEEDSVFRRFKVHC